MKLEMTREQGEFLSKILHEDLDRPYDEGWASYLRKFVDEAIEHGKGENDENND